MKKREGSGKGGSTTGPIQISKKEKQETLRKIFGMRQTKSTSWEGYLKNWIIREKNERGMEKTCLSHTKEQGGGRKKGKSHFGWR